MESITARNIKKSVNLTDSAKSLFLACCGIRLQCTECTVWTRIDFQNLRFFNLKKSLSKTRTFYFVSLDNHVKHWSTDFQCISIMKQSDPNYLPWLTKKAGEKRKKVRIPISCVSTHTAFCINCCVYKHTEFRMNKSMKNIFSYEEVTLLYIPINKI